MKIGLVLATPPAYSETFFRNKIRMLEGAGHEVLLFTGGGGRDRKRFRRMHVGYDHSLPPARRILPVLQALLRLLAHPLRAARLYGRNRADGFSARRNRTSLLNAAHIIGHDVDWLHFGFATNAVFLENLAGVIGARMAVSIRGYDIGIFPIRNPGCYALLWRRIDRLHYISDDLLRLAIRDGFPPEKRSMKITPAIDTARVERHRTASRPAFNMERPAFATIGRLHWKKGFPLMLTALSRLRREGLDFTYDIIGDGGDGEQVSFLLRMLELEGCVRLHGRLGHGETLEILAGCDIYLQYSLQEGFCNAVLEAQLLGRLCIVSDAEGLAENVVNGETGWVVPRNDAEALAERVKGVLDMPRESLEVVSRRASERVRTDFTLEGQLGKFLGFYGG